MKLELTQQQNVYDSTYKKLSCSSSKLNYICEPKNYELQFKHHVPQLNDGLRFI